MVSNEDPPQTEASDPTTDPTTGARGEPDCGLDDASCAPVDPGREALWTSVSRVMSAIEASVDRQDDIRRWAAGWMPVVAALGRLAVTAAKLGGRIRQRVGLAEAGPPPDAADGLADEPILDDPILDKLIVQFGDLVDAFPTASAWFFGVDHLDAIIDDIAGDRRAQAVVGRLIKVVEARLNALIGRLVEWGLGDHDDGPELTADRLERFVDRLECLLQDVLDRWVVPHLHGQMGDDLR